MLSAKDERNFLANYVLVLDLGDVAAARQYIALTDIMYEFGFTLRGPETLRPAQFSVISALPLGGLKHMVEDRIRAELLPGVTVDAYEIKRLTIVPSPRCRGY